jgi:hypothetical protein
MVEGASTAVAVLKTRCIAAAAGGGDPDACTSCVDAAEIHVPFCGTDGVLGQSKCQMLNAEGDTTSLPPEWFNAGFCHCNPQPDNPDPRSDPQCGYKSRAKAFEYCTGTSPVGALGVAQLSSNSPALPEVNTYRIGVWTPVQGIAFPPPPDNAQRLRPMVTAYEETVTFGSVTASDQNGKAFSNSEITSTRDDVLAEMLGGPGGLPLYSDKSQGYLALMNRWEDVAVPTCGQQQRMSFWNVDCNTVVNQYNMSLTTGAQPLPPAGSDTDGGSIFVQDGVADPVTGSYFLTHTGPSIVVDPNAGNRTNGAPVPRCSIREARTFVPACAGGAVCTSGGSCVFARSDASGNVSSPTPAGVIVLE